VAQVGIDWAPAQCAAVAARLVDRHADCRSAPFRQGRGARTAITKGKGKRGLRGSLCRGRTGPLGLAEKDIGGAGAVYYFLFHNRPPRHCHSAWDFPFSSPKRGADRPAGGRFLIGSRPETRRAWLPPQQFCSRRRNTTSRRRTESEVRGCGHRSTARLLGVAWRRRFGAIHDPAERQTRNWLRSGVSLFDGQRDVRLAHVDQLQFPRAQGGGPPAAMLKKRNRPPLGPGFAGAGFPRSCWLSGGTSKKKRPGRDDLLVR